MSGEAFRPFKILYATAYDRNRAPDILWAGRISREFQRRYRAIFAYGSQFRPTKRARQIAKRSAVQSPLDRLVQQVDLTARFYGEMAGVEYAEPFLVREVMQVDDVVKLPVCSV